MSELKTNKVFRFSRQREKILEIVKNSDDHPSADIIYIRVREEYPSVSMGTVYRNLNQLVEMGIILEILIGKEPGRFEYGTEEHPHFKCELCGCIYHIEIPIGSLISRGIEKNEEHQVNGMQVLIWGKCKGCLQNMYKS